MNPAILEILKTVLLNILPIIIKELTNDKNETNDKNKEDQ